MAEQQLRQGTIVWTVAVDPRGNRKRRPLVLVSSDKDITSGGSIVGAAVTTTFPQPPPPGYVEIPWDPTGRAATGLRRRSAAVCSWLVTFEPESVDGVIGKVPAATLLKILQLVSGVI